HLATRGKPPGEGKRFAFFFFAFYNMVIRCRDEGVRDHPATGDKTSGEEELDFSSFWLCKWSPWSWLFLLTVAVPPVFFVVLQP
ncbi:hypothetical protein, partial [Kaistella carnis]|uniref:hypothetical protein n=1 Tax=Kaistella carnis TaxID=1241979 RepID=UPI00289C63EA